MQPARVAQRRREKIELLTARSSRLEGERDGDDWMFGAKIFQMRLEEAKQNFHGTGRIGNLEMMLVGGFVGESETEGEVAGDEIVDAEPKRELLEETAEDEKERLGGFDFVFELELLFENLWWPNESQKTGRCSAGLIPETGGERTEAGAKLVALESGEIAQGVDAPFVKNGEKPGDFGGVIGEHGGF